MSFLFEWSTMDGDRGEGNSVPANMAIFELQLKKRKKDPKVRPHEAHPEHEEILRQLPQTLGILRMDGCRCRTFPRLPTTIQEVYARQNDFFTLPDLSAHTDLIVLELADGRLETLDKPLPPNLARFNVEYNAIRTLHIPIWPYTLATIHMRGNSPSSVQNLMRSDGFHWTPPRPSTNVQSITEEEAQGNPEAPHPILGLPPIQPLPPQNQRPQQLQPPRQTVYENEQNVHDHGIQTSIQKNLDIILHAYPSVPSLTKQGLLQQIRNTHIRDQSLLESFTKKRPQERIAKEYAIRLQSPYSMFGHSLFHILERHWAFLNRLPTQHRQTALQRLEEECQDAKKNCTNGFVARMINVFVGLDERIVMKLESSQILQARVPLIMKQAREKGGWREGDEPWEWSRDCFNEVCKTLTECDERTIQKRREWLDPFFEGFVEAVLENGCTKSNVRHRWISLGIEQEQWAITQAEIRALPDPPPQIADSQDFTP